jgi:hypothetical protein
MPESDDEREKRLLRELKAKNVAHYSVMLDAWIQTRMALDKSLITLSAGGVGVLVTLLTTVGVARPWQIYLYRTMRLSMPHLVHLVIPFSGAIKMAA